MKAIVTEENRTCEQKKARVFVSGKVIENVNSNDRKILKLITDAISKKLGGSKVRFSRTAGCSCGCSPGFIVEDKHWNGREFWMRLLK